MNLDIDGLAGLFFSLGLAGNGLVGLLGDLGEPLPKALPN